MNSKPSTPTRPAADLQAVVGEVLGELAFMIADDEPVPPPDDADWLRGEVRYDGRQRGVLRCTCTRGFGARLAEALLGYEFAGGQAEAAAGDALRELLNVLCGHWVTQCYGAEAVFTLSIPVVRPSAPPPAGSTDDPAGCRLSVDGEVFWCAHEPGG